MKGCLYLFQMCVWISVTERHGRTYLLNLLFYALLIHIFNLIIKNKNINDDFETFLLFFFLIQSLRGIKKSNDVFEIIKIWFKSAN